MIGLVFKIAFVIVLVYFVALPILAMIFIAIRAILSMMAAYTIFFVQKMMKAFTQPSQANNPSLPSLNQVLIENGIMSHPTHTGRIQATVKAITKVESQLDAAYERAITPIDVTQFETNATNALIDNGVGKSDAEQIMSKVLSDTKGTPGLANLNGEYTTVTPTQFWNTTKFLEKYQPLVKGEPDMTKYLKQNTKTIIELMRYELSQAVPQVANLNGQYSVLRNYVENGYKSK